MHNVLFALKKSNILDLEKTFSEMTQRLANELTHSRALL